MENCAYMKKVIVEISSRQSGAQQRTESIEMKALGNHYVKGGICFVVYRETDEQTGAETSTMLKIAADSLTLVRRGGVRQQQLFAKGQVSVSDYATPYGTLQMRVKTHELAISRSDDALHQIKVDYDLYLNGSWQSRNELAVTVRPAV